MTPDAAYMRQWRADHPTRVAHAKDQNRARRWAHAQLRTRHQAEYEALVAQWWDAKARAEMRAS